MKKYSIIICTYNRFELLIQTINSLGLELSKRNDYEIIIVDNNSDDHTSSLEHLYKNDSFIYYHREMNQGLSFARNRGIIESRGKLLVFLDDDIEIYPGYFDRCDVLYEDESMEIVGGKVLPFNSHIPEWLPKRYYYLASIFDLGNKSIPTDKLMGANYTMRREVAKEIGYYDVSLGRKGAVLSGGEEIDYLNRGAIIGKSIKYDPHLIVYHKINEKLHTKYLYDYAYQLGKSELIIDTNSSRFKVCLKIVKCAILKLFIPILELAFSSELNRVNLKIRRQYANGYLSL